MGCDSKHYIQVKSLLAAQDEVLEIRKCSRNIFSIVLLGDKQWFKCGGASAGAPIVIYF